MRVRGRYAPSPSGPLHLGNARTALAAWRSARLQGGAFVLRVEDLDRQRSRPELIDVNLAELRWLGIDWDEGPDVGGPCGPYVQSARFARYEEALERLRGSGHTFGCWLSRKDVLEASSAPHGRPHVYGPAQRALNAAVGAARRQAGKASCERFLAPPGEIAFVDREAGPQRFDILEEIGDFVLRRADGEWAYQLAVVVDDLAMGITEEVRGEDLLVSTGAQLLLYAALGAAPPVFAHVPLLLDEDGQRMAKRRGSQTLSALREAGASPEALVGRLAHSMGWVETPAPLRAVELLDGGLGELPPAAGGNPKTQ